MSEDLTHFQHSDMWVLISISEETEGSDLADIIGYADALNHSILTVDELNFGLSRLIHNGYVETLDDRHYRRTDKAKVFFTQHDKPHESALDRLSRLSSLLERQTAAPRCEFHEYVTQADHDKAY